MCLLSPTTWDLKLLGLSSVSIGKRAYRNSMFLPYGKSSQTLELIAASCCRRLDSRVGLLKQQISRTFESHHLLRLALPLGTIFIQCACASFMTGSKNAMSVTGIFLKTIE